MKKSLSTSKDVPHLLKPRQACALLAVSRGELKNLRDSSQLAFYPLNRRVFRYAPEDIADYLSSCRVEAAR